MKNKLDKEKLTGYLTIAFFTIFLLGSFTYVGYLIFEEASGHSAPTKTYSDPNEVNTCRGLTCN